MPDNKDKVKGCVHPEDSWTDYGCGDCGDYADNNGCRGPRGKMDIKTMSNYQNPSVQLREAYNRTLKEAELSGSTSFYCGPGDNGTTYVSCRECPLNKTDCDDKHDVKYWRQWWEELTGEEDNDVDLLKKVDTDNIVKVESKEEVKEVFDSHAEGPISNIPNDFKDIYLKVYDSAGNLILSDEYTLESKGLKKTGWTRISENTPESQNTQNNN